MSTAISFLPSRSLSKASSCHFRYHGLNVSNKNNDITEWQFGVCGCLFLKGISQYLFRGFSEKFQLLCLIDLQVLCQICLILMTCIQVTIIFIITCKCKTNQSPQTNVTQNQTPNIIQQLYIIHPKQVHT